MEQVKLEQLRGKYVSTMSQLPTRWDARSHHLLLILLSAFRALLDRQTVWIVILNQLGMSMENKPKDFLPTMVLNGQLTMREIDVPVSGTVCAGDDGRLKVDLTPQVLNGKSRAALHEAFGRPGMLVEELVLNAISPTGEKLSSDHAILTKLGTDNLAIELEEATITVPLEHPVEKPRMVMWLRGVRNFGPTWADTPLGCVRLMADIKDIQPDNVSGCLALEANNPNVEIDWRHCAERFLTFMRAGLQLAHGGRLQQPILEVYEADSCEATFYAGVGSQPEFKVQNPLNARSFFKTLAKRYFKPEPWPDALWIAQGWMHVETTHDEVRFIGAMTALETLVEALPEKNTTILSKVDFKLLRESLLSALNAWPGGSEEARELYRQRICQMNQANLRQNVEALLEYYDVRADDLLPYVPKIIDERNEIVHRGEAKALTWELIIVVREIVTRLVLKALLYEGPYECYLGGMHTREFPACTPQ